MLGYLEISTEGDTEGNLEGLLLDALLVSVVGLVLCFNKGTVLGYWNGKFLGRTLGALVGI